MSYNLHIIKKYLANIMIIVLISTVKQSFGQDTLAGNYPLLTIKSGITL